MNMANVTRVTKHHQPKPAAVIASALVALTFLLGACGGDNGATATPAAATATLVPTSSASTSQGEATSTSQEGSTTPGATSNGALSETVQAAASSGITNGETTSGTADVAVITSTQLITGTEVVTNVQVSTNTAVIAQQLITTVITNTNMVSNVVQSNESSTATKSSIVTDTSQLTPESSTGQAVANVTITPLPPTATPTVVVEVTRVVTATRILTNTESMTATATPQAGAATPQASGATPVPSQGQGIAATAPLAAGTVFTGVANGQGKTILASALLNSKFLTSDGQISGKLDDLVVDMQSSQLLYLLLTYGGVLSVGESRVAVPLNAMSLKDDGTFLLNIPPDHLQNFPDIGDDWPQAGSPNWDTDVRNFWDKEGFKVGFDPSLSGNRIRRIGDWNGAGLNDIGLGGGTVQDEIVSLDQGRVPYVLVSFANAPAANATGTNGAAAGVTPAAGGATAGNGISNTAAGANAGPDWYAIPLNAFDPNNTTLAFGPNINASTFEGAPRFNQGTMGQNQFLPNNYDQDWQNFWNKLTNP